jgi:hypothetical protein
MPPFSICRHQWQAIPFSSPQQAPVLTTAADQMTERITKAAAQLQLRGVLQHNGKFAVLQGPQLGDSVDVDKCRSVYSAKAK